MSKYVVFVDEILVAGTVQMAAANSGFDTSRTTTIAPLAVGQELQLRRNALESLAANLSGPAAAAAGTVASAAAQSMNDFGNVAVVAEEEAYSPRSERDQEADEAIQILEGVSAIVVDDARVDIDSLTNVVGLTVMPNIEIPLPFPEAVAAAAPPSDWHLREIGLNSGTAGGKDILIGILDTGIDAGHPEFAGKTVHFAEFDQLGRRISTNPRDAGDHGTHVSSIAAGAQAGVAPDADLAVAAVLTIPTPQGMSGTLVQIVNGFNWLVTTRFRAGTPGVDVINASLGGGGFNTYLQESVRTAFQLGIPLIAAIGNAGRRGIGRHGSPGNYPEVLSVGATDDRNVVAEFSDWGVTAPPTGPRYPIPDLCAPGVAVHAARPGGGLQPMSGTSMATPVVTGVAARRMSNNRNLISQPAALFTDLRSRLAPYQPSNLGNLGGAGRIVA